MNEETLEATKDFFLHPIAHIVQDENLYAAALVIISLAGLGILAAAITLAVKIAKAALTLPRDSNRVDARRLTSPTITETPPSYPPSYQSIEIAAPLPKAPHPQIPPYEIVPNTVQPNRQHSFREEPLMA